MTLKETAKYALMCFLITMTGIVIFAYVHMCIFDVELLIRRAQFGQFIIFSFFCSLSMLIFYSRTEISDRAMLIRQGIHFCIIASGTMYLSLLWRWILPWPAHIAFMLAVIVIVYGVVCSIILIENKYTAARLNKAIQRKRAKREDQM